MPYIISKQPERYRHMTINDLYNPDFDVNAEYYYRNDPTATLCRWTDNIYRSLSESARNNLYCLQKDLYAFGLKYQSLIEDDMSKYYYSFFIPKRNGKKRRIDAPQGELKTALEDLKDILSKYCGELYHTNAFAYIKGRQPKAAVVKHQHNESRWFMKFDFSNFFGSTTYEFLINQLLKVFPFSTLLDKDYSKSKLYRSIFKLCFLEGKLPQGTPVSPILTNIMMIPIDYLISKSLTSYRFVYTRYADDLLISHRYTFDSVFEYYSIDTNGLNGKRFVQKIIEDVLQQENAPFTINSEKTRYGSSSGHNFCFGMMLNKDNQITIGHKKKDQFKALLHNYLMAKRNETPWSLEEVQVLNGTMSYFISINKEVIDNIVNTLNKKYETDVLELIKHDLSSKTLA